MDEDLTLLTEKEVSKMTGLSPKGLSQDRVKKRGFPYIKRGPNILYIKADVIAYLNNKKIRPIGDDGCFMEIGVT